MSIDVTLLRKAASLAMGTAGQSDPRRIVAIYKVLTPHLRGAGVSIPDLEEAGFVVETPSRGRPVARSAPEGPVWLPAREEMLEIAYRYALSGTRGAPDPVMADFSRFANAVQTLQPEGSDGPLSGRKLRRFVDGDPGWRIVAHVPTTERIRYERQMEVFVPGLGDDEAGFMDAVTMDCSADEPGALRVVDIVRSLPVLYVRPTGTDERPHRLEVTMPSGEQRRGWSLPNLSEAYSRLSRIPTCVVETGTRIRAVREPDEVEAFLVVYSREGDAWLTRDGDPIVVPERLADPARLVRDPLG